MLGMHRMRRLVLSTIVTAATAATASAEPALSGNVLVWADARLYLDARDSAANIRFVQLDGDRAASVGQVLPMHVVGTGGAAGGYVEVEPTAGIECAWWRAVRPPALASLHLFVKRDDLAPVVTRAFTAAFKDGSRIALQPGVAVGAGVVAFGRNIIHADVPDANRGLAYAPHAIADIPPPGKHTFLLDENTEVTLGDQAFTFGPWVAATATRHGDRTLVAVATRCMTAVLSAPKDRVQADVQLGHGLDGTGAPTAGQSTSNQDRYYLAKGTKLTSADGDHVVATLAGELDLAKPTGDRACADIVVDHDEPIVDAPHANLASRPDRTLHLCAPASAVQVEQRSKY